MSVSGQTESPPSHPDSTWHPKVPGGIAVGLVNCAFEQLIFLPEGELLWTAAGASFVCSAPSLLTCRGQPFVHLACDKAMENKEVVSY